MYEKVIRCRLHLHTFGHRVRFKCIFFKCAPNVPSNVSSNVHFVFPDFPRIVEIQMYLNVHLHTFLEMYPKCTLKCTLKCNPDVHFVFPDFPNILHLSTFGFPNVRKCNLQIVAQMYGNVFIRQMHENVLQMYSKCTEM